MPYMYITDYVKSRFTIKCPKMNTVFAFGTVTGFCHNK